MQQQQKVISFPVVSFRRLETPNEDILGKRSYLMAINVNRLASDMADIWKKINPRHANTSSSVSKDIRKTLEEDPKGFFYKNRGLTILANKVAFDNKDPKKNTVKIEMTDQDLHGLLDGGHTFEVILEFLSESDDDHIPSDAFIKVEVLEGFRSRDEVIELVASRNTSSQVKDVSLLELSGRFKQIHEILGPQTAYGDLISYREYEEIDGKKKPIPVQDILSYLICFDAESFDSLNQPVKTYSVKAQLLDHYDKNMDRFGKYMHMLPKILELWDTIRLEFPQASKKKLSDIPGVKVGKKVKLYYLDSQTDTKVPVSYIYPILSAFRGLVLCTEDHCEFITDPVEVFQELKSKLVSRVVDVAMDTDNPNKVGKYKLLWQLCSEIVDGHVDQLKK